MISPNTPRRDDVDNLLRNAQLRDALEPLYDESIGCVNVEVMTTGAEHEFWQSMLDWERAPILAISDWFSPRLEIAHPDDLDVGPLQEGLHRTISLLFEKQIVLDFTDHLSDRQLYTLIYRDILPAHEKMIVRRTNYLHWDCAHTSDDPDVWLRYYATDEEREIWANETGQPLPAIETLPFSRKLPRAPLECFNPSQYSGAWRPNAL